MVSVVQSAPGRRTRRTRFAVGLGAALLLPGAAHGQDGKHIHGWVENVLVEGIDFQLKAKLDTGAATSSLDARDIRRFRRGKKRLVSFNVVDRKTGESVHIEREYVRSVRIKRHGTENQRRPIVKLSVCLGMTMKKVEFTLTDRTEFLYPILLGRSTLEEVAVVDPELTFTSKPKCDADKTNED